jgi:hypothetical protein
MTGYPIDSLSIAYGYTDTYYSLLKLKLLLIQNLDRGYTRGKGLGVASPLPVPSPSCTALTQIGESHDR